MHDVLIDGVAYNAVLAASKTKDQFVDELKGAKHLENIKSGDRKKYLEAVWKKCKEAVAPTQSNAE